MDNELTNILLQQVKTRPAVRPARTKPISQEQFEIEVKADRLRELHLAFWQISFALCLVALAVLYVSFI